MLNKLINYDLKNLSDWLNANKIMLNVTKTELVIFKPKHKKLDFESSLLPSFMLLVLPLFFFFFLFISGELRMACSSNTVEDSTSPGLEFFFPRVRFCFSLSKQRFFFKRSIKVSFSDELLSLTSRFGNLDNGSLGSSGHIPHALNPDCK